MSVHPKFLKNFSGGSQAQGQWSHKAMTCAWGMCVHCTFTVGTCQLCPVMSEGESKHSDSCNKECNIVRTHFCDSKNAKMRSRNAFSDCNQQNPIFKYH